MAEQSVTRSGKGSSQRKSEAQSVSRGGKGSLRVTDVPKTTQTNPVGRRYGVAIGPQRSDFVARMPAPTGEARIGSPLNRVAAALKQIGPAARKATPAPVVKPASQVVSNVVRERLSPAPATKTAVAPKAKETAYQRQQRMAQQKMGVVGPRSTANKASSGTRSTGGGMRSSGGGAVGSTSGTRGYSSGGNAGRGDVGGGRRGGGR